MKSLCGVALMLAGLLAATPCWATDNQSTEHLPFQPPLAYCQASAFQLCGASYIIPPGPVGSLLPINLPDRYVINSATFQCVSDAYPPYFRLMNGEAASCIEKTCKPADITVCDKRIPLGTEAKIGDTVRLQLPDDLIDPARMPEPHNISVACNLHNGDAQYDLVEDTSFSCNSFLCQPVTLKACDTPVEVLQSAPLGAVLNISTPKNQPVTVQCLGSVEGAPHFAVTDFSCN